MMSLQQIQFHWYILLVNKIVEIANNTKKNMQQAIMKMNFGQIASPHKVIQAIKKIQFIAEFFVLSKYSKDNDTIAEFLLAIQAFKFYFRMAHFSHQENIYMESYQQQQKPISEKPLRSLSKMSELLEKIKTKAYEVNDFQHEQHEVLASGKKVQLVTSVKVPETLKRTKLTFSALFGQVLSLLRPLLSIIAIRIYGLDNYKSYLVSLVIDLFILLVLERNLKVSKKVQMDELHNRKKEIVMRYLFRRPLFLVLKRFLIEPCLQKLMRKDRFVYKIILSLLEMQSSITLTL